jgi:hypothetical protein
MNVNLNIVWKDVGHMQPRTQALSTTRLAGGKTLVQAGHVYLNIVWKDTWVICEARSGKSLGTWLGHMVVRPEEYEYVVYILVCAAYFKTHVIMTCVRKFIKFFKYS